jgi:hypothetical protein
MGINSTTRISPLPHLKQLDRPRLLLLVISRMDLDTRYSQDVLCPSVIMGSYTSLHWLTCRIMVVRVLLLVYRLDSVFHLVTLTQTP